MWHYLNFLVNSEYLPGGAVFFWDPWMIYLQAVTNGIVAISYAVIAFRVVKMIFDFYDITKHEPRINRSHFLLATCFALTAINYSFDTVSIWIPTYDTHAGMRLLAALIISWTAFFEMPHLPQLTNAILKKIRHLETDKKIILNSLEKKTVDLSEEIQALMGTGLQDDSFSHLASQLRHSVSEMRDLLEKKH